MEFLIGALLLPLVLFLVNYKKHINKSKPEIILETIFNHALSIRNIGESNANSITETTNYFSATPDMLRSYTGDIDYYKNRDRGIYRQIDLRDLGVLPANELKVVRFEYKNLEGHKFFSEIEIKRNADSSPPWFFDPKLIRSGRVWF